MYDRILLPTDGSRGSSRAIDQAIDLAAETGAELHVLFVVEDITYGPEMMEAQVETQLRQIGEEAIEEIRDRGEEAGIPLETDIDDGVPHKTILEYAEDEDMDLIVMGTHGRSGLDRYLLGSVTERVVRSAETPVLTVRVTDESED